MSVAFNQIPGAGLVAPIFAFEVNSGGQFENNAHIVLQGFKQSSGTMAFSTPVYAASQEAVDQLAGSKSMLRDMFRVARANAPAQEIWIQAVDDDGLTAGTWTMTVGSVPTIGGTLTFDVAGERMTLAVAAGATAANVATAIAGAVNGYFDELTRATLPVTATAATNVVTLTAIHKGAIMGDLDIYLAPEVAGNIAPSLITVAAGTAAAGNPNLSSALAALGDQAFDGVVSPFSDATNLGRYATTMSDTSGRWAWSRQSFGHVWTVMTDTLANLVTAGLTLNDRHITVLGRIAASGDATPAWAWLAGYAARQFTWLSDGATGNVSRNMTGLAIERVRPPRDKSRWALYENRNTLLKSGISTWDVNAAGQVTVDKTITTMRLNALGQPDTSFRDVQSLYQVMYMIRQFRADFSYEHGQKALADRNPGNNAAISTPRDIKATAIRTAIELERKGVLEDADGFANRVVVVRDTDNRNRVNVLAPIDRVNALDILAVNATFYSQYPGAPAAA